jgi:hypothetical protein
MSNGQSGLLGKIAALIELFMNSCDCDWCQSQSIGNIIARNFITHKEILILFQETSRCVNVRMLRGFPEGKSSDEGKGKKCSPVLFPTDDVLSFVPFKTGGSNININIQF